MAEQELDLVNKVELRIALADTDSKFQSSLDTYLAPLLLKLASPHPKVRQEIFKFIQHLVTRISSSKVSLPVIKLVKQAKSPKLPVNAENPLNVQLYSLLFAAKGIDSLDKDQACEILPIVIEGISKLTSTNVQARMLHIFLKLLQFFPRVFPENEQEVKTYREILHISTEDEKFLISKLEPLMVLNVMKAESDFFFTKGFVCNGLSPDEINFLTYDAGVQLKLADLYAFKVNLSKFLMVFDRKNVSLLVLLGALDIETNVSSLNSQFLRYVEFPLENDEFINHVLELVLGDPTAKRPPINDIYQFDILQKILCSSKSAINSGKAINVLDMAFAKTTRIAKFSEIYAFIRNMIHHSTNEQNTSISSLKRILQLLKNKIQSNGWPKADIAPGAFYITDINSRNKQYELIGEILAKDSRLLEDLTYIEFLFDSLAGEDGDVKSSVRDALSSISLQVGKLNEEAKTKLKKIIRNYMKDSFSIDPQTVAEIRFLSLKLLNTAFPFNDAEAKFLNVLGCSFKNRHDVINEANLGLNPYFVGLLQNSVKPNKHISTDMLGSSSQIQDFIDFEEYVNEYSAAIDFAEERSSSSIHTVLDVVFNIGVSSIVSNAVINKTTTIIQDDEWQTRITRGISCDPLVITETINELQRLEKLDSAPVSRFLRITLREYIKSFEPLHPFNPASCSGQIPTILSMSPSSVISELVEFVPGLIGILKKNDTLQGHAAITLPQIIAILVSHQSYSDTSVSDVFEYLLNDYYNDNRGNRVPLLIGTLSEIVQKLFARQRFNLISPDSLSSFYKIITKELSSTSSTIAKMVAANFSGILRYGGFGPVINESMVSNLEYHEKNIMQTLEKSLTKFGPAGYHLLALSTLSQPESVDEHLTKIESALLDSYETKDIDIIFSIGEALSIICSGWDSTFLKFSPSIQDVNFSTNTLPRESIRISIVLSNLFGMTKQTKPTIRRASCVWLLALVQYCGKSPIILEYASKIHFTFMKLLTDSDEVVQDAASRGLGIVYELGDADMKETLVKSLLRSFADSTSASKFLAGTVNNDTELFEPGVLKTHDGSVSTYKDILSLATEVGDPSLIYKFMSLAKTSALWSSRRGIAFGLGNIMSKASLGRLLVDNPTMAKRLIPKLYRYRFDPNSHVSQSMEDIWKTLVPDSSMIIEAYSFEILNELLSSMGKNEWRVRQAATVGLTDMLQTLSTDQYKERQEEIWTMGFRALDDIKESVRRAGANLTRNLSKSLVQAIKTDSSPARSHATLLKLLPFLLGTKGINSDSDDIREFSLQTLISLVKSAGKNITPFIAELIEQFVQLMSTLEPQIMNYLALNAEKYKIESDFIDSRRVQSLNSSPIMDTIERLIDLSDEEVIGEVVAKLRYAIKSSVGLPSKFAGSKIIVSLVLRHSQIIKPYSDTLLLTCSSRLNDNNNTVASSYAVAAGYVCRVASLQSVLKYSKKIQTLFFGSETKTSTTQSKQTAGIASLAVSKHSGERFIEVATAFLPIAFICKNDDNNDVSKPFELEWSDNTSGVGAIKLYLEEIVDLVVKYVDLKDYGIRRVVLKSITKAFDAIDEVTNAKILSSIFKSLISATRVMYWNGKEEVFSALVSVSLKSRKYLIANSETFDAIKNAILKASTSTKKGYTEFIIISVGKFVKTFPSNEIYEQASPSFVKRLSILNDSTNENDSDVDSDEEMANADNSKKTTIHNKSTQENLFKEKIKIDTLKSFSDCFQAFDNCTRYHLPTLKIIINELKSSFTPSVYEPTWKTNLAIVECLKQITSVLKTVSTIRGDSTASELILSAWKEVVSNNFRSDTIENIRVQSVRFAKTILETGLESLSNEVREDLNSLMNTETSSIVKVEIGDALK